VVAVAMDARRRDEAGECSQKLEGREGEDGAAVAGGSRGQVEDLADAGIAVCCGGGALLGPLAVPLDTQSLQRKGRSGAVTQQALAAGGIGAMDADRCVEAKAAAGLPGEHVLDGVLGEEAAALEEAEHAALQRALARGRVCRRRVASRGHRATVA
jgi:hypothetical protein